jgi:twitching motility protein PilT
MPTTEQQVFRKIVLHNKMMNETTVDRLLSQLPNPEDAVKYLVKKEKLAANTAKQLMTLYRKQMDKVSDGGSSVLSSDESNGKPSTGESFAAMFDDILTDKPSDSASKAAASADDIVKELKAKADTSKNEDRAESTTSAAAAAVVEIEGGAKPVTDPAAGFTEFADQETVKVDDLFGDDEAEEDDLPMLQRDDNAKGDEDLAQESGQAPAAQEKKPAKLSAVSVDPADKELLHNILRAARKIKASDVHITAGLVPIVRVVGKLQDMDFPPILPEQSRKSLLALANERRYTEFLERSDLDFCYDAGPELGRFRTNFMIEQHGMNGVFRLIDTKVPSFEELGLPDQVRRLTDYSHGMVLVTGPKGCGKTTTLAAMVDLLNSTRKEHIIMIEDPIEYVHPKKKAHLNQREVGTHTKTFGTALRAALREAPDIIVVGEMRDVETTSMAITAAETGHLVLATMHTPDALRTIDRVLDVFPPKEQSQIRAMLSESLRGVVSQSLIPNVDETSLELALEILINTPAIGNVIRENRTFQLRGMMQTGRKLGMELMDDSLIKLAKEGRISRAEAISRATEFDYVRQGLVKK